MWVSELQILKMTTLSSPCDINLRFLSIRFLEDGTEQICIYSLFALSRS